MYDELLERLHKRIALTTAGSKLQDDLEEAADAIEGLQEDNAALNGTVTNLLEQIKDLGKPRWIPVTEQLPRYGTPVLAYGSRGGIFVANYERKRVEWDVDYWWKLNSSIHVCNPTHWMPLPEPPKEGEA